MLTIIVMKEDIVNIPQKKGGTKGISLACKDIAISRIVISRFHYILSIYQRTTLSTNQEVRSLEKGNGKGRARKTKKY
jgi:hypothetical protein